MEVLISREQELLSALSKSLSKPEQSIEQSDKALVHAKAKVKRNVRGVWKEMSQVYCKDLGHKYSDIHQIIFTVPTEMDGEVIKMEYYADMSALEEFLTDDVNLRKMINEGTVKWKPLATKLRASGLKMVMTESAKSPGQYYYNIVKPDTINADRISIQVYNSYTKTTEWKSVNMSHVIERLQKKAHQRANMVEIK